jgi:hypothetical protein
MDAAAPAEPLSNPRRDMDFMPDMLHAGSPVGTEATFCIAVVLELLFVGTSWRQNGIEGGSDRSGFCIVTSFNCCGSAASVHGH